MTDEIRVILQDALDVLEFYEEKIDGEWGSCRNIDELYRDGDTDIVLLRIKVLLETAE